MHAQAFEFVARSVRMLGRRRRVLELGSRNVNGTVRALFANADCYIGLDWQEGPGVDVVADAAAWRPTDSQPFDTVVSTECLEHAPDAAGVCLTACQVLVPGGVFILTAAGPNRKSHGADGGDVRPEEFYANIHADHLRVWLAPFGLAVIEERQECGDIYAIAVKIAR